MSTWDRVSSTSCGRQSLFQATDRKEEETVRSRSCVKLLGVADPMVEGIDGKLTSLGGVNRNAPVKSSVNQVLKASTSGPGTLAGARGAGRTPLSSQGNDPSGLAMCSRIYVLMSGVTGGSGATSIPGGGGGDGGGGGGDGDIEPSKPGHV